MATIELLINQKYFESFKIMTPIVKGYPKDINKQMIDNNLVWASKNRERILKEWKKDMVKENKLKL